MKSPWIYTGIAVCLVLLAVILAVVARGQTGALAAQVTVDGTKMGAYRALTELSYQDFQKNDLARAAVLARILERTWDKGEGDLRKSSSDTWSEIDSSMDGYIKPILGYASNPPDSAKVKTAYNSYLEKLKQAD